MLLTVLLTCRTFFGLGDCELLFDLFGLSHELLVASDDPQREVWVMLGLLTENLSDFNSVSLLLRSQEIANTHLPVVTKLKCSSGADDAQYLLTKVIACFSACTSL